MVALFLDANVAARLAVELSARGLDAISANVALKALDDASLMFVASTLSRVLVTTNTSDSILLHHAWLTWTAAWDLNPAPKHSGLLLFHTAPRVRCAAHGHRNHAVLRNGHRSQRARQSRAHMERLGRLA